MEGSATARGEGSSGEKEEKAPRDKGEANKKRWAEFLLSCEDEKVSGRRSPESPDKSAPAQSPPIMAEKLGDNESLENERRIPLPTITTERSSEPVPSLEEKVRLIKVTMSARAQKISVLEIGAPTTQVEPPPQGAAKTPAESEANNMAGGRPQTTLFPYKKKKPIKPLVVENLRIVIVGERLGQNVSGQPAAPNDDDVFDEVVDGIEGVAERVCEQGHYCSGGNRTECPSRSFCPAGSSAPTVCPKGTYTDLPASGMKLGDALDKMLAAATSERSSPRR
jgi:hypothetical protein